MPRVAFANQLSTADISDYLALRELARVIGLHSTIAFEIGREAEQRHLDYFCRQQEYCARLIEGESNPL